MINEHEGHSASTSEDAFIEENGTANPNRFDVKENGQTVTFQNSTNDPFEETRRVPETDLQNNEEGTPIGNLDQTEIEIFDEEYKPVEDIYAMLVVFPYSSKAFIYAFLIFLAQIIILGLFIVDQLSKMTLSNPFDLPVMTDSVVLVGQAFALYATAMTSSDVTQSLDAFYIIYDKGVEEHFPQASHRRWIIANMLRCLEGTITIIVAFLFIVQSTENLELFQNFAAVAFVSEMDNLAFYLADKGYAIIHLTGQTTRIKEKFIFKNQPRQRQVKSVQKRAMRILLFILYAVFFQTVASRKRGFIYDTKCQSFITLFDRVDFDFFQSCEDCLWKNRTDNIVYPNFNGIYEAKRKSDNVIDITTASRPRYIQKPEGQINGTDAEVDIRKPRGEFMYCQRENAWVFIIEGVSKSSNDEDSCNWLMRSPETREYDLNLVPKEGWVIWTGLVHQAENFRMTCSECEKPYVSDESTEHSEMQEELNAFCNYHGVCSKQKQKCRCESKLGWIGVQCQICADCESYQVTSSDDATPDQFFYRMDNTENLPLEVHSRPAFYRGMDAIDNTPNPEMLILLHTGNRYAFWNVTDQLTPDTPIGTRDQIFVILANFHSQWVLTAETVPFRSTATKQIFPFNLTWSRSRGGDVELIFKCISSQESCSAGLF